MVFTTTTVPLTTKNQLDGIISKLKNSGISPIDDNYVVPSAKKDNQGSNKTLVLWDSLLYQAGNGAKIDSWVQLSFPKGLIYPTAYSMRGSYGSSWWPCFAKTRNVYGIFEGDENNEEKWDLLGTNNTSESTYCNSASSYEYCADNNIGTFTLKPMPSNKGYKHIRWRSEVASCGGNFHYFATSGIDVYGTLSSSPSKQNKNANTCFCRCSIHRNALTLNLL